MIKITIQNGEDVTELETDNYFLITDSEIGVKASALSTIHWINRVLDYKLFCKMRDDHIEGVFAQSAHNSTEQPSAAIAEE
jgi:hypothetical protein